MREEVATILMTSATETGDLVPITNFGLQVQRTVLPLKDVSQMDHSQDAGTEPSKSRFIFFLKFIIYFIYFWLHQVLVEARGIFVEARGIFVEASGIFRCGVRALPCGAWASL